MSSRVEKYTDKIRSAEGTDPIFYVSATGGTSGTANTDW